MSYQMPRYKVQGRVVVHFAGWKEHFALYPGAGHAVAALKDALKDYEVSKGAIRFPLTRPVPAKLIEKIAKGRAKEVAEKAKAKASTTPKDKRKAPRK